MNEQIYLAVDLDAESGRVMAGAWNGRQLRVEELHRFSKGAVTIVRVFGEDTIGDLKELHEALA